MKNFVRKVHLYFIPTKYKLDEVIFRKTRIFVNTCFLTCVFALMYLVIAPICGMNHSIWMLIASFVVFFICPWLLKYGASLAVCANIYASMAYVSTFWHAAYDGGLTSGVLPWIILTAITAILFNGNRNGWFWVIASALGVIVLGVLQIYFVNFIPEMKPNMRYMFLTNSFFGLVFITFLISYVLESGYTSSLVKLDQKNQQVEWERLKAEHERRRAQESEQAKQQFLANMSHEIRTPINAITGFTTLLLEKNPTEEQRKYLEIVEKSTDSLRIIINDILDLTKIEVGKMPIEKILFEPKEIVELIISTLRPKADAKKLELKLKYDATIPPVLIGDPTRLNQILANLLDNAIKFTEKGSVLLTVEQTHDKVKFMVTDTGIGMTPEQMDIVFEPFRQAEMGTTRKYGGTGLGLHISKQLVELQNGVLDVESTPGKGSTFSFEIEYPVSPETSTLRKKTAVSDEVIKDLTGIKILLAEDNEFNRIVATETLQLKIPGVIIDTVTNGKEAIEKLKDHDVIIMDVHMPLMDGYEATRRIRSDISPVRNQVPIIALTASIVLTDINKCLAAGMNGFVPKPFNINELLLALHDALKRKQVTHIIKPENVANTNGNVTDLTFLKESCGNDDERIKKYISMYLKQSATVMETVNKALKEKNYDTLKNTVHTFKVQLKYMGMHDAELLAKNIELTCIEQPIKVETLPAMITSLNDFYMKSVKELTNG